jgi:O-antigen/teichoic acid export membrane protein
MGDQALSTLTNFALNVVVARHVAPVTYGAFALVQITYQMCLGVSRALNSEPLIVRHTGHADWRDRSRAASGSAVGVSLVMSCIVLIAAAVSPSRDVAGAFVVFAAVLPGLMLQDVLRYSFIASRNAKQAFLNDLGWAVLQIAATELVLQWRPSSLPLLVGAWGVAGAICGVVGIAQARALPRVSGTRTWLREHRELAGPYVIEFLAAQGATTLTIYAVTAVVGLAPAGGLRAAQTLFGPITVLGTSLRLAVMPEMVRVRSEGNARLRRSVVKVSALLAAAAIVWGCVGLFAPDSVGRQILGRTWLLAHPLLFWVMLSRAGTGATNGVLLGLRGLGNARRSLRARIWATVWYISLGIGGAVVDGARGAAIAMAAVSISTVAIWWRQFTIALRENRPVPIGVDAETRPEDLAIAVAATMALTEDPEP